MPDKQINDFITISLSGRIDSSNAASAEEEILSKLQGFDGNGVTLDADKLEYISSVGLRFILRLRKKYPGLSIINVNSDIYEILEMTGFTEMMTVQKAYRVISVEGCEVIGEGNNGKVYRIDGDNVVKTYKNADALSEIRHEREVARLALILGVPTAISYDIVRVGDSYGSVFELLDAKSFSKIIANEPERFDWCVAEYVGMLKKIHSITVPAGKLPSVKEKYTNSVKRLNGLLPDGLWNRLTKLIADIPETDRMIHGDYHTKNIVLAGDEVLMIDMDTLSVGHPVFELAQMYNAYIGFSEYDHDVILRFQGYDFDTATRFWHETLAAYFGTHDEAKIKNAENKIKCIAYAYLIDWNARHKAYGEAASALWKERLTDALADVDTLNTDLTD